MSHLLLRLLGHCLDRRRFFLDRVSISGLDHIGRNGLREVYHLSGSRAETDTDPLDGGIGIDSDKVRAVLERFDNVFYFSGHSHRGYAGENRYAEEYSVLQYVTLSDPFGPYLRPNVYVHYTADYNCVKKAKELGVTIIDEETFLKMAEE